MFDPTDRSRDYLEATQLHQLSPIRGNRILRETRRYTTPAAYGVYTEIAFLAITPSGAERRFDDFTAAEAWARANPDGFPLTEHEPEDTPPPASATVALPDGSRLPIYWSAALGCYVTIPE